MKNKNSFWGNPWIIGIGTAVLGVILLRVIDQIANTKILDYFLKLIKAIGTYFNTKYVTPLWFLIILFFAGAVILFLIFYIINKIQQTEDAPLNNFEQGFLQYTSDTFDGILYKWGYSKGYDNKYNIIDFVPYCPKDNCVLYIDACPICTKYYHNRKDNDELQILVRHKIENNLHIC